VTGKDGEVLEFTKENVIQIFHDLPDLFTEVITESQRIANYVSEAAEADSKS
jgi:hypothetical protein